MSINHGGLTTCIYCGQVTGRQLMRLDRYDLGMPSEYHHEHFRCQYEPSVAVVVPCRNREWDRKALLRLLASLEASDFPKQYSLFVPTGGSGDGWESRKDGCEDALRSGIKFRYIVSSDNDSYVPPQWWTEVVKIFDSDHHVGAVTFRFAWDGFLVVRPEFCVATGIRDGGFGDPKEWGWRVVVADHIKIAHDKNIQNG
jgi:hypothetical protein